MIHAPGRMKEDRFHYITLKGAQLIIYDGYFWNILLNILRQYLTATMGGKTLNKGGYYFSFSYPYFLGGLNARRKRGIRWYTKALGAD